MFDIVRVVERERERKDVYCGMIMCAQGGAVFVGWVLLYME